MSVQAHSTLVVALTNVLPWLEKRWQFVWESQRFLLGNPSLHKVTIEAAFNQEDAPAQVKIVVLLSAILPTLGIGNQKELEQILSSFPKQ